MRYVVCGMRYAVCECECECEISFLLQICEGTSKFLVNSMAFVFAFTPIGALSHPLVAFAFAFGHMEAPLCGLHAFIIVVAFPYCILRKWNLSLRGPDGMAESIERPSPLLGDWGTQTLRVQTLVESNIKIDTCHFLSRCAALLE